MVKAGKEGAEKENDQFRAHMEIDFQRKLAEGSGNSGANVNWLEQETEARIHQLKTEAARVSHDIV